MSEDNNELPIECQSFEEEFASVFDYAKMYRSLGFQVVPAISPTSGKNWKRPALPSWKEFTQKLCTDEQFEQWFSGHQHLTNIGLLTGPCSRNLFIIDLDIHKNPTAMIWWEGIHADNNGGIMLEPPTQKTGGGGLQMLFIAPDGWTPPTIKTSIGVDIRGVGGFAVVAPSKHEAKDSEYQWLPGMEPYTIPVPVAPDWLCKEVDTVGREFGGVTTNSAGERVRTATPANQTDEWGHLTDGREDKMYRMVFRTVIELYRECPFIDTKTAEEAKVKCFNEYVDLVETRIREPGTPKHLLLEREGRGSTLFDQKWRATMRQWETKISDEAQKPLPPKNDKFEATFNKKPEDRKSDDSSSASSDPETPPEGLFRVYRKSDLKALPPAEFIIEGLLQRYGSNYITGWPGCGKSFYGMGACIAISTGQKSFLGKKVNVHGPIVYVTTEGIHDHYTRMRAYEVEHGVNVDEERYLVIPDAMNLLEGADRTRLLRTIDWNIKRMKEPPVLVVFDTVSRVIPGADENNQKEMSLFVKAENEVQQAFSTTTALVHHLSRSGNGNMRGSTVLEGSADTIVVLEREPGAETGILKAAKMKSAPDGWELEFKLHDVSIDAFTSSLVISEAVKKQTEETGFGGPQETGYVFAAGVKMSVEERDEILRAANDAWHSGEPWSVKVQTKYSVRYAPMWISKFLKKRIKNESHALAVASAFVEMGYWSFEIRNSTTKLKGLKVSNMYQNGTNNVRKTFGDGSDNLRDIEDENQ